MAGLEHTCKEWEGTKFSTGYGATRLRVGDNQVGAHRVAYCEANGVSLDDIKGQLVRHKCDNRPCVEPTHLELGNHKDNHQDSVDRGRHSSGERHGMSKLRELDVLLIRARFKLGCPIGGRNALAREFGVSKKTISNVVNSKNWRGI